jgi:hypothetical protein
MKRFLAIEELGTSFQVEQRVPLVRLKGHWLKAAGFTAGKRVTVTCLSPGVMELRAETVSATPEGCAVRLDFPSGAPQGSGSARLAGNAVAVQAEFGAPSVCNESRPAVAAPIAGQRHSVTHHSPHPVALPGDMNAA